MRSVPGNVIVMLTMALSLSAFATNVHAQFDADKPQGKGVQLGEQRSQKWQVGVKVEATRGVVRGLLITMPIPTDWDEQTVRVIEEDYTTNVGKVTTRILEGGVKQMVVTVPQVRPGEEARAIITMEVLTNVITPPEDTSIFVIPKRAPREVRKLLGNSPYIDARHSEVKKKVKKLTEDVEPAWDKVAKLYEWTRQNVALAEGNELKGSLRAIRDGTACGEDRVGVFVAMCRAAKIPSRIVWVQGHFYAEFFLQDAEGEGHWFPAELVGAENLGGVADPKPILQKGDNIKVPEMKEPQRYVPEFVKGKKGSGLPRVTFVREILPN